MVDAKKPQSDYAEIRSHSSMLSNQRISYLFFQLDMASLDANQSYGYEELERVRSTLYTIWKNIRSLVRFNFSVRRTLNLETSQEGVYTVDVMFNQLEKLSLWCKGNDITMRETYIMIKILNGIELIIRDILQYFQYTFRHEFKQMPDVLKASEDFKQHADKLTVEQLKEVLGPKHQVDLEHLGKMLLELDEK